MAKIYCIIILMVFCLLHPIHLSASGQAGVHWGYEGVAGPTNWGNLSPTYTVCKKGLSQSPINITNTHKANLGYISFHYTTTPLKILNNGHTIQVNYAANSFIKVNNKVYKLQQFHFHSPSEHRLYNNFYDMEVHLVHKNDQGELAVVGIFMKQGRANSLIQNLWNFIPSQINFEQTIQQNINAAGLLPSNQSYYHYSGSLTTPPCSENVNWYV